MPSTQDKVSQADRVLWLIYIILSPCSSRMKEETMNPGHVSPDSFITKKEPHGYYAFWHCSCQACQVSPIRRVLNLGSSFISLHDTRKKKKVEMMKHLTVLNLRLSFVSFFWLRLQETKGFCREKNFFSIRRSLAHILPLLSPAPSFLTQDYVRLC